MWGLENYVILGLKFIRTMYGADTEQVRSRYDGSVIRKMDDF